MRDISKPVDREKVKQDMAEAKYVYNITNPDYPVELFDVATPGALCGVGNAARRASAFRRKRDRKKHGIGAVARKWREMRLG